LVEIVSPQTMPTAERKLVLCFIFCEKLLALLVKQRLTRALVDLTCEKLAPGFKLWSIHDFVRPSVLVVR
jgi:hypothetical protein